MNERIQELAALATKVTEPDDADYRHETFDKAKFAELIVLECLSQVEEQYKRIFEDETMMKDNHWAGYVECGIDSCVAIKEHLMRRLNLAAVLQPDREQGIDQHKDGD
jgi:hypothetical protein